MWSRGTGTVRLLFFFFQAEDGIRDVAVTGVQTCALPISTSYGYRVRARDAAGNLSGFSPIAAATTPDTGAPTAPTGPTAPVITGHQSNLSRPASMGNVGEAGCPVERGGGGGGVTGVRAGWRWWG